MKRVLFSCVLIVSLVLLQPTHASLGEEKAPMGWKNVKGVQMLRLWEQPSGPKTPQVVILKLSAKQFSELEENPLAFYKTYEVFSPSISDRDQGHAVFNLRKAYSASSDDMMVVADHDVGTYSAFVGFQVESIK